MFGALRRTVFLPQVFKGYSMHPVHDVDALLLLALALSSKRRPAELAEIMAAADLIQGSIPSETKLGDAFHRLSTHGLINEVDGRFTLTPDAQKIMAGQPRKAETAERIFSVREKLSAYEPAGKHAPIVLTGEQLAQAILAHRSAGQGAGKNMLVPKPKTVDDDKRPDKRPGQWRRPFASRKRKA
ncbi:hypothetical protein [Aromatoleum anaerobium]|nr:hypothetical protein [Aromatoleum anaerobium]MCK0507209.1 hypothetical protein [Aromatoleum anaerobium]